MSPCSSSATSFAKCLEPRFQWGRLTQAQPLKITKIVSFEFAHFLNAKKKSKLHQNPNTYCVSHQVLVANLAKNLKKNREILFTFYLRSADFPSIWRIFLLKKVLKNSDFEILIIIVQSKTCLDTYLGMYLNFELRSKYFEKRDF